jgi:hypothetical protein
MHALPDNVSPDAAFFAMLQRLQKLEIERPRSG